MNYEQLLTAADQEGLLVKEQPLTEHDGLIRGSRIAIRKDIEAQAEKSCVLAEEIGHYRTSSGNILDQNKVESRKQEYRARLYGYNLKIGLAQYIHRHTASEVFHVPFNEVTDLQRRNAKAVNFGIVYGISSFGLSQDLSITRKEAAEYIERYFETYPKIKGFLDGLVEEGKEKGYVTTMFGRRRPIPELKSGNFMQRSFGERVAMNSPIQGTAADIIKIAMNRVYRRLKDENLKSRLVLQVHDELLIETCKEEIPQVSAILEEEMKGAAKLSVELEVDMHQGNNWYEAK